MLIGLTTMYANALCFGVDRFSDAERTTLAPCALAVLAFLTIWGLWQGFYWLRSRLAVRRIVRKSNYQIRRASYSEYKKAAFQLKICLVFLLIGYSVCGFYLVKSSGDEFLGRFSDSKNVSVLVENATAKFFVESESVVREEPKKKSVDESDETMNEARQIVERQAKEMKEDAEGRSLDRSEDLAQNESRDALDDLEEKNEYGYDSRGEVVWVPFTGSGENNVELVSGSSEENARLSSATLTGPLETQTTRAPARLPLANSNGTPVGNLQNDVKAAPSRKSVSAIPAAQLNTDFFETREDFEVQRRLASCFTPEEPLAPYPQLTKSSSSFGVRSVGYEERVGDGTSLGLTDDIWSPKAGNAAGDEGEKSILIRIDEEANRISSLVRACVLPIQTRKNALGSRVVEEENGCGFLTQYNGKTYVVTNNHVVDHALSNDAIKVFLPNNRPVSPKKVFPCDDFDLAALEIDSKDLPKDGSVTLCRFGDSDSVRVANSVFAIGSPFGLEQSLTYGHVSSLRRCNRDLVSTNQNLLPEYIQIDAAINPGNSGGPLYDSRGDVIGIVTAIATTTGKNEGVAFAIPINVALRVVKTTIDGGVWKRSRIGVELEPVTRADLVSTNLPYVFGAKIVEVSPRSPAQIAGLKPGDVVLTFNGKQVENDVHLARMVALADASEPAKAGVLRGANYFEIAVKLEQVETKN